MADVKSFLHQFCQRNKVEPQFEVRPTGKKPSVRFSKFLFVELLRLLGPKHRQRFLCEVRVDGFNYTGVGNSTNKKDAQNNASRDFVNFLVRQRHVNSNDVPTDVRPSGMERAEDSGKCVTL